METAPGTNWVAGWVDTLASLDGVEERKYLVPAGK
jgi:hypothetical protein